ncbi:site-2 protease family protein [Methanolobus halotolerans]|uniref:Peptidase n=1 Tax=Methanolobus halotolerans TaxID=2052935 RepID=A0A4E0QR67_9EURY|nr:site-2 protease family protein [Methanolobus halotolerans]TGC08741.1 peptidase [Methanolobus halotolerans]
MNGTTLGLTLFLVYWIIVIALKRKGILERYNISTYGPVLMIRTTRGLKLLDILAKPGKAWKLYANIGIVLMFIGMAAMFLIVILSDIALLTSIGDSTLPEPGKFNEARNIFLIPGVNEFIPLTWGIIALIVTLVVHEFSHAILCRVEDIRVKSMGILLALVPIGGFAEPDEEELFGKKEEKEDEKPDPYGDRRLGIVVEDNEAQKQTLRHEEIPVKKAATRNQRARILAAGVMANFVVALIAFSLLFGPVLGAMAPLGNTMVVDVNEGSNAYAAGIREGMVITQLDGTNIGDVNEMLFYLDSVEIGSTVQVHAATDRAVSIYEVDVTDPEPDILGIMVQDIVEGSPAEETGFEQGMYILSIDGQIMRTVSDFTTYMSATSPGQNVVVEVSGGQDITNEYEVELAQHPDADKGYLGVYTQGDGYVETSLGFSVGEFPAHEYLEVLREIPSMLTGITGWVIILGLPIIGITGEGFPGFSGTLAQFYEPIGWAEPLGIGLFWIANSLLWIGWLNFYVGLFNCLPAVPLDGGHVFRDYMYAAVYRLTKNETKAENLSATISATFALLILMSFILMIFGPYLVHGF